MRTHPLLGEYFSSHLKTRVSAAAQVKHSPTLIRDLLRREPVLIESKASIREAAQLMSRENVSSVLVMQDQAWSALPPTRTCASGCWQLTSIPVRASPGL